MKLEGKELSIGDEVFYKGGSMQYEGPLNDRKGNPIEGKLRCSWYDKELQERVTANFKIQELTLTP